MSHTMYPCLWFEGQAKAAATYYCSIFKNATIVDENPMVVIFELNGSKFMALNGGPQFNFTEAISFVIPCDTQVEIDHYWNSLTADGGQESRCGWLKDKFGVSWQIVPAHLGKLMADTEKGARVMQALMKMDKLDIATLENA
jgi:predicted 3-demethylubiquinone-9 3-methyltransferase (glyoxalase superfamily)